MIGFGEKNEEFGNIPPALVSCEEICNDEGFAKNSLMIKISTWTGITMVVRIQFKGEPSKEFPLTKFKMEFIYP